MIGSPPDHRAPARRHAPSPPHRRRAARRSGPHPAHPLALARPRHDPRIQEPGRLRFTPGDLRCLLGYGVLYETAHLDEVPGRDDLTLVLVVASITPTLRKEIEQKGWTLTLQGGVIPFRW